ncbi:MAG: hypothetical protein WD824_21240 [Cyclobacteriaceae bacterium]
MKKFPRRIAHNTAKALLARSGNQCAYPNCTHPVFNESNLLIAELCHIEALSPKGPRYNPNVTADEVNSYQNLVFLCHRHHRETDSVDKVSLLKIKADHENTFRESGFSVSDEVIKQAIKEIQQYWAAIERVNSQEHVIPDHKVDIDANADELKLINEVRTQIENLNGIIGALSNDEDPVTEHFELLCLAQPNVNTRLSMLLDQLEIKIMQTKLMHDPTNNVLKTELENKKLNFLSSARNAGLAD